MGIPEYILIPLVGGLTAVAGTEMGAIVLVKRLGANASGWAMIPEGGGPIESV